MVQDQIFSTALRLSSEGVRLWTHYDIMDNVLCNIRGRKRIRLWRPEEVQHLYVQGSTSAVVDIDHPNLQQYPLFERARHVECILGPGDMLFIPAQWFHNVVALEPCVSVNIFWKHLSDQHYESKDLYGNKDLPTGSAAVQAAEQAAELLRQVPTDYRAFYARQALSKLWEFL